MSTQPEALRLADALAVYLPKPQDMIDAAAELRRLHTENERIGLLAERVLELKAQRDALLEALRKIAAIGNKMWGTDWEEIDEAREIARAAIKAVEGEKT